jgi:hypothetical protein
MLLVDSEGFCQWDVTHRKFGVLDFVHCSIFLKLRNTTFRKLNQFLPSGEGRELPNLLGPFAVETKLVLFILHSLFYIGGVYLYASREVTS